ncbi:MAG: SdrD B-like domain-containing protein, partial [Verrucomicrobiota bacterium]
MFGQVEAGRDFGFVGADPTNGIIGDLVWSDANGDGLRQMNEPGIGGVQIRLIGPGVDNRFGSTDDVLVTNTVTTSAGAYWFNDIAAGSYRVLVVDGGGTPLAGLTPVSGPQSFPGLSSVFPLEAGEIRTTVDFGYTGASAAAGDRVFFDVNNNGMFDGPENGVEGVSLNLRTSDGSVIASTLTDGVGGYGFPGLPAGVYSIEVTDVDHVLDVFSQTFGAPDTDNQGQVSPYAFMVTAGQTVITADFGFAPPPGSVGNRVFVDNNRNGVFEPAAGEKGLAGVEVLLRDSLNNLLAAQSTADNGLYAFPNLPNGDYSLEVNPLTLPPGIVPGPLGAPGLDNNSQSQPLMMTVSNSMVDFRGDFGYVPDGSNTIGDLVFFDFNTNGAFDAIDEPIAGLRMKVYADVNGDMMLDTNDALIDVRESDTNGFYAFPALIDTQYLIVVCDPSGILIGGDSTLGASPEPVDLGGGGDRPDADFGFRPAIPPPADLAVTKTDGNAMPLPGQQVMYTISVTNVGIVALSGVVVTDQIPNYVSAVPAQSTPGWSCGPSTQGPAACTFDEHEVQWQVSLSKRMYSLTPSLIVHLPQKDESRSVR